MRLVGIRLLSWKQGGRYLVVDCGCSRSDTLARGSGEGSETGDGSVSAARMRSGRVYWSFGRCYTISLGLWMWKDSGIHGRLVLRTGFYLLKGLL